MNILWHSNASWVPSGYGSQTRTWLPRLKAAGHDIVVSTFYGLEGAPIADRFGVIHLPRAHDPRCNDIIKGHYYNSRTFFANHGFPDVVFSLVDPFAMKPADWKDLPWCAWTPVDSDPLLQELRGPLDACHWPLAMSRFGESQLKNAGYDPLYCPHGVDSEVFKPIDRRAARIALGEKLAHRLIGSDKFLVVASGANTMSTRKNWSAIFEAFALFAQERKDALLYVHADADGTAGLPLESMVAQLDILDRVMFPPSYAIVVGTLSDEALNIVYNAADVKISLSKGEGFGLTDVEAQLCGTPVITSDFSASREVNLTGWHVGGQLFSDIALTRWLMADVSQAVECLDEAYRVWDDGDMPSLRARTRDAAMVYDADTVMKDYMTPVLEVIQDEAKRSTSRIKVK